MFIPRPDDYHVHFRQGDALGPYVRDCAVHFGRALVMPNTLPPIADPAGLVAYRTAILAAARDYPHFVPLMTFKVLPDLDPASIASLKTAGAVAGKLYPQGATTNSADGVSEVEALFPVFAAMEAAGVVLCLHGEDPRAFSLDRESAFLPKVSAILQAFPRLKVVLEHVTSAEGIRFVMDGPDNLGATVTIHHVLRNLDHMLGGHLHPHLFCKPILKRPSDQEALKAAVLSAHPRVFFGSDSAPHTKVHKECDCGAAGVYTMPVALSLLAGLFAEAGSVEALAAFTSGNGSRFYNLPLPTDRIELIEDPWDVPAECHGVVPFCAGTRLHWRVASPSGVTGGPAC